MQGRLPLLLVAGVAAHTRADISHACMHTHKQVRAMGQAEAPAGLPRACTGACACASIRTPTHTRADGRMHGRTGALHTRTHACTALHAPMGSTPMGSPPIHPFRVPAHMPARLHVPYTCTPPHKPAPGAGSTIGQQQRAATAGSDHAATMQRQRAATARSNSAQRQHAATACSDSAQRAATAHSVQRAATAHSNSTVIPLPTLLVPRLMKLTQLLMPLKVADCISTRPRSLQEEG